MTSFDRNGQPPGFEAPIFNAMNNDQLVAYVPRPILCIMILGCVGLWILSRSWGAVLFYGVLHGVAAYFTYRDPSWLPVLKESLQFRYRLWRLLFAPEAWRSFQIWAAISISIGVLMVYVMVLWMF